jgi:hypothetical protein
MAVPHVAIATMTVARTDAEEEALRTSLSALGELGVPVVLADGGSAARFLSFVDALPATTRVIPEGQGLVGQITASLRAARASGAEYVLYTEPDKTWFFRERLTAFLGQALASAAPVVIAARNGASFATFPDTQRFTETIANRVLASCALPDGDYFYGPFLMRACLIDQLSPVAQSSGWGWRPFLFTIAHRLRLDVAHVVGEFPCPLDQRHEDERDRVHRLRQLAQNVEGVAQAMAAEITSPRSPAT